MRRHGRLVGPSGRPYGGAVSSGRFRLEAVLRVRRIQEDSERGALRRAHSARELARASEEEARLHYGQLPQTLGYSGLDEFLAERARAGRAAEALALRGLAVRSAEQAVDERRRRWSDAAARVSMLERLEDRHRRAREAEIDRREVQAVEELASVRFLRAQAVEEAKRP